MKVCIIGDSNISYMPYMKYYEEILSSLQIDYDILYWDRFNLNENKINAFGFRHALKKSIISRMFGHIKYRRFLLKHLKEHKYDFYIVLSAQAGMLLNNLLKPNTFIFDIRDYSHENICVYKRLVLALVKRASLVCISSPGFKTWLPSGIDYTVSHNTSLIDLSKTATPFNVNSTVISYIGFIKYFDNINSFNSLIKNSPDLFVRYIGADETSEGNKIKQFCMKNSINNVEFVNRFSNDEIDKYYNATNFVHCCFGNFNEQVKTLLPNRLYKSCIYKRPIIVSSRTYLAEIVSKYGIGIVLDINKSDHFFKDINKYYDRAYYERYANNCNRYLETVIRDIEVFQSKVREILTAVMSK